MIDATTVNNLIAMLPDQEDVTLLSRGAGEAFAAGVTWRAQRLPRASESAGVGEADVSREAAMFRLLTQGQTVVPKKGDRITDAAGVTWEVARVAIRLIRTVFNCECVRDV